MSVPNRPESEYNAALKMWGGKWGAAIPLLLLICGLLWLSLHGPATPKNFWSIGFAAICIGLFLSKTPKEYWRPCCSHWVPAPPTAPSWR